MKTILVVCCDGTSNSEYLDEDKSPLTNVSRISRAICQSGDNCRQIVLYLPGIGTDEGNVFNPINQGFGIGINTQIKSAYTFLCHNYCQENNDEIILIGFSRGAFAVRCIIDLVLQKGLLCKESLHHLPKLFQEWINSPVNNHDSDENKPDENKPDENKRSVRKPSIKVCALWDSVNSVGFPRPRPVGRGKPTMGFVHSRLPNRVENAFQAISLFEHRFNFHPIVLRLPKQGECTLEQCWFPGYHSDIGGGNNKEALAHFALAWMITKLKRFLSIDEKAFWYRKNGEPTWVLPDKNDLEIPDPYYSSIVWRAARSEHRQPRIDFWRSDGIHREDGSSLTQGDNDDHDFSREKIHASVRFMSQNQYLKTHFDKCQSLRDVILTERETDRRWVWKLRVPPMIIQWWKTVWGRVQGFFSQTPPTDLRYNLWEDKLENEELEMLNTWVDWEHDQLLEQENTRPGAKDPKTIIVRFKAWVAEHQRYLNPQDEGATGQ